MNQRKKTGLITLGAALSIVLAALSVWAQMPAHSGPPGAGGHKRPAQAQSAPTTKHQPPLAATGQENLPEVGVRTVTAGAYQARVSGYGEVTPRYALTLSAQVAGRIDEVSARFQSGETFEAGDILARIDETDYQQALDSADATLQQANVALQEEQLQGAQAQDEWQRSGLDGDPDSALVLRAPQLAAAKATVRQAQSALQTAQRDLQATRITAPFDAVVVSRAIQPGSIVQTGTEIGALYATATAEISIPLSASQWQSLPDPATLSEQSWPVILDDMNHDHHWRGRVTRVEQHLDTDSRQRSAIVVIDKPLALSTPLYFGTYVNAQISGRQWQGIWEIPASAISQQQKIWYVSGDNTLGNFTPEVLFQQQGNAYIQIPEGFTSARIVLRPLNSYMKNMLVKPVSEGTHAG
ncbi:efflux RND transporter periplasmic adaptor subunit [Salinimonas lutimaris]|uniref:efflux RND transporter periplasmic adaptor subunit n=1 Tax=Salinimonas lutimaris TaxID=914153 RepID=UPI0010C027D5|nr:efflux RND transporter periplasmic adaptor subunit [Salinimonas lutimaris]